MKRIITPISIFILLATSIIPAFAGNTVAEIEYFYSDDGTIIGKAFNGKRVNYEYDLRGQLLAVKDASGNDLERYTYDPAGNRLSKTINGVTTTYSYDEANQLIRSTVNGEITYYEYDAAGRMIQAGDKSYIYNGNNKVIEVRQNGETIAKFEYNIDGQIAKAIYGDKKEEFIWDGLALIWRSGVTYINEPYVTGGNPVMAGDDVLFNDMLGSTLAVNDKAVEMTSFGETDNEKAFFTGKPMIDELGYSFLFRDYNPNQGKWTTVDPLGYPDGWNQLAYCNNGVTSAVDLWGCFDLWPFGDDDPAVGDPKLVAHCYGDPTAISGITGTDVWCKGTKPDHIDVVVGSDISVNVKAAPDTKSIVATLAESTAQGLAAFLDGLTVTVDVKKQKMPIQLESWVCDADTHTNVTSRRGRANVRIMVRPYIDIYMQEHESGKCTFFAKIQSSSITYVYDKIKDCIKE